MKQFTITVAVILAAIRLLMVAKAYDLRMNLLDNEHFVKSFEAAAHILVGGLLVGWLYGQAFSFKLVRQAIVGILLNHEPIAWGYRAGHIWILTTLSVLTWVEIISATLTAIA